MVKKEKKMRKYEKNNEELEKSFGWKWAMKSKAKKKKKKNDNETNKDNK